VEGRHISAVGKFVGEGFIKFDEVFVWPKEMLEDGRSLSKWIDTFESSYGYESDTHFYKDKHGNIIHNVARSPTVGPATASGDPVCLMPAVHQLKMKIQAAYKDEQTLVASKKGAHDGLVQWIGVRTLRRRMGDGIADEFSFPLKPVGVNRNDVFDWCTKFWSTIKEEKAKSKTSMKAPARRHELARLVDKYSWDALGAQKPQKRKKGCSRWPQGLLQVASRTKADINYVDGVDPDEDTTAGMILRLAVAAAAAAETGDSDRVSTRASARASRASTAAQRTVAGRSEGEPQTKKRSDAGTTRESNKKKQRGENGPKT
jgi:hypothetical protein